ncbi:MAG: hypothetical protein WBG08_08695 [Litorimonas sp.]
MRAVLSILALCLSVSTGLAGCAVGLAGDPDDRFTPRPGQGQYVRPDWLNPAPTPRLPAPDPCRSQLYAALLGVNEGAIYIPGLPGTRRIIRPAVFEGPINEFMSGEMMTDTYVEVQAYQAGQLLYAPSIGTLTDRITIGPERMDRLTIVLDREGYVQELSCG